MESAMLQEIDYHRPAFEPVSFAQRQLPPEQSKYHVYRSAEDYVEVIAESAYEALARSGVREPARIRRYSMRRLPILFNGMLEGESIAFQAPAKFLDQPTEAAPQMEAMSAPISAETPLSDDDIERLLGETVSQ